MTIPANTSHASMNKPHFLVPIIFFCQLNSTQQDITDVGADTSYVRIYMSN